MCVAWFLVQGALGGGSVIGIVAAFHQIKEIVGAVRRGWGE